MSKSPEDNSVAQHGGQQRCQVAKIHMAEPKYGMKHSGRVRGRGVRVRTVELLVHSRVLTQVLSYSKLKGLHYLLIELTRAVLPECRQGDRVGRALARHVLQAFVPRAVRAPAHSTEPSGAHVMRLQRQAGQGGGCAQPSLCCFLQHWCVVVVVVAVVCACVLRLSFFTRRFRRGLSIGPGPTQKES